MFLKTRFSGLFISMWVCQVIVLSIVIAFPRSEGGMSIVQDQHNEVHNNTGGVQNMQNVLNIGVQPNEDAGADDADEEDEHNTNVNDVDNKQIPENHSDFVVANVTSTNTPTSVVTHETIKEENNDKHKEEEEEEDEDDGEEEEEEEDEASDWSNGPDVELNLRKAAKQFLAIPPTTTGIPGELILVRGNEEKDEKPSR